MNTIPFYSNLFVKKTLVIMSLVNVVEFATPSGNKSVELHHLDLIDLEQSVDALIISAFPNDYRPTSHSLIGALAAGLDVSVADLAEQPLLDYRGELGCWVSKKLVGLPFSYIVCTEGFSNVFSEKAANEGFKNLFAFLAMLPYHNLELTSIALPVLGTGDQGLPADVIIQAAMYYVRKGLSSMANLQNVYFFERDREKTQAVLSGLSIYLNNEGFDLSHIKKMNINKSILNELRSNLQTLQNNYSRFRSNEGCEALKRHIEEENLQLYQYAILGRKFIELAAISILGVSGGGKLSHYIKQLKGKHLSKWVIHYFHVVAEIGNRVAHNANETSGEIPGVISHKDVQALSTALVCISELLINHLDAYLKKSE